MRPAIWISYWVFTLPLIAAIRVALVVPAAAIEPRRPTIIASPSVRNWNPALCLGADYAETVDLLDRRELHEGKGTTADENPGMLHALLYWSQKEGVDPAVVHILLANLVGARKTLIPNVRIRAGKETVEGPLFSFRVTFVSLDQERRKDSHMGPLLVKATDASISPTNFPDYRPTSAVDRVVGVALVVAIGQTGSLPPRRIALGYLLEVDASGRLIGGRYSRSADPKKKDPAERVVFLSLTVPKS